MTCKNCNTALLDSNNYCSNCGAKTIRNRLTLRNLMEDFSQNYFNIDNKFLKTFLHLFSKPEAVIGSYIDGTRKRYINPISFLAISLTLSGMYFFFFKKKFAEIMTNSQAFETEGQQKLTEAITNFTTEYNSLIYFVIIPVIGLISLIVFYDKKYNFTEHTVIYLYSMPLSSVISILISIITLLVSPNNYMFMSIFIYVFMFTYHGYILKRIFQLNAKQLIIKILIFIPLFFVFYIVSSIVVTIIVILTGEVSFKDLIPNK